MHPASSNRQARTYGRAHANTNNSESKQRAIAPSTPSIATTAAASLESRALRHRCIPHGGSTGASPPVATTRADVGSAHARRRRTELQHVMIVTHVSRSMTHYWHSHSHVTVTVTVPVDAWRTAHGAWRMAHGGKIAGATAKHTHHSRRVETRHACCMAYRPRGLCCAGNAYYASRLMRFRRSMPRAPSVLMPRDGNL